MPPLFFPAWPRMASICLLSIPRSAAGAGGLAGGVLVSANASWMALASAVRSTSARCNGARETWARLSNADSCASMRPAAACSWNGELPSRPFNTGLGSRALACTGPFGDLATIARPIGHTGRRVDPSCSELICK